MISDYTKSGNACFCPFPGCLSSFGIMITLVIAKRQKAKRKEEWVPQTSYSSPERTCTFFSPVLACLFPSSCEKFPVRQINQSSKNRPDITSSCLHVSWSLKELNLFKIVTTFWKRGQSLIRDTRDFCSLSSSRKLLKMNLARKAELGSPLAEFPM